MLYLFFIGYWETLGEDLTVTKFAPNDANQLVTASSDGQVRFLEFLKNFCEILLATAFQQTILMIFSLPNTYWHMFTTYLCCASTSQNSKGDSHWVLEKFH